MMRLFLRLLIRASRHADCDPKLVMHLGGENHHASRSSHLHSRMYCLCLRISLFRLRLGNLRPTVSVHCVEADYHHYSVFYLPLVKFLRFSRDMHHDCACASRFAYKSANRDCLVSVATHFLIHLWRRFSPPLHSATRLLIFDFIPPALSLYSLCSTSPSAGCWAYSLYITKTFAEIVMSLVRD